MNKSSTFLGVDVEKHGLNLKLRVLKEDGSTELKNVDLIETAIYLLGIEVEKIYRTEENYFIVKGKQNGEDVALIFRDPSTIDVEKDKIIIKREIVDNTSIKKVYVNAPANIEGLFNIYDALRERLWQ